MIIPMNGSHANLVQNVEPMEGATRYIVYVGDKAVGVGDVRENQVVIEPHITWLSGVTKRQMSEAFLEGLRHFGRIKNVVLSVTLSNCSFYDQWVKRGLLRKVGFIEGIDFENIGEIHIYQLNRSRL